jgi:hypothetical protein
MTRGTEIASLRFPCGTLARLRRIAHVVSLKTGTETTWAEILRELVDRNLTDHENDATNSRSRE